MLLPKIKTVHNPERLSRCRIRIGTLQFTVGSEIQDDENGTIWYLLQLMDGTRSNEKIIEDMLQRWPDLDEESLQNVIDTLIENGFVVDEGGLTPTALSKGELERYSRSADYFAWIDTSPRSSKYEIQNRLKLSHVVILGMGGTGSSLALSLAASGIGSLHCVDCDRVEESNLNRQILYTEKDIGMLKAEVAARRLQELNSSVKVTHQHLRVQSSNDISKLMEGCSLFALCADQPPKDITRWTNEAALKTNTPWLISAYAGPMLQVGMFIPNKTPCYYCLEYHENQKRDALDGENVELLYRDPPMNAVIAPVASLTGHLGALEAIYFLGGLKPQTQGRVFHQNLIQYDHYYYIEAPHWPECPMCGRS